MTYLTTSPTQTKKLGENLAKEIIRENSRLNSRKFAKILALEGELGSGKTTFLQGFAKGLGIKQKILSPTFVIMKTYNLQLTTYNYFYHIDCYRIEKPREILDLGFKEIISNPENVAAIEWASKIKKILPKNILILKFKFIAQQRRSIVLKFKND